MADRLVELVYAFAARLSGWADPAGLLALLLVLLLTWGAA